MIVSQRPKGVKEIAYYLILVSISSTIGFLFMSTTYGRSLFGTSVNILIIYYAIMMIFSFITAFGLLKGMTWAWSGAIFYFMVIIIANILLIYFEIVTSRVFIVIGLSVLALIYLTRAPIKAFFGKADPSEIGKPVFGIDTVGSQKIENLLTLVSYSIVVFFVLLVATAFLFISIYKFIQLPIDLDILLVIFCRVGIPIIISVFGTWFIAKHYFVPKYGKIQS